MPEYKVYFRFTVEGECRLGGSIDSKQAAERFVRSDPQYAAFGTVNDWREVNIEEITADEEAEEQSE